ncbi:MAG: hypothetical protein ING59_02040 [Burkholderiales bacterium]|jgi:hypothetical protein|nr:hypothetical protein [Burkholderiales bacterium]
MPAKPTSNPNFDMHANTPSWLRRCGAALESIALGIMWLGLPLAPVFMALIRWDIAPLRRYPASWRRAVAHTSQLSRVGVIRRGVEQRFAPRGEAAYRIEGGCTHCGQCCVNGLCVFVDFDAEGRSSCAIHGKWFFRWLSCGVYPRTQRDIDAYACPSFRAVPPIAAPRRVLTLKVER